MNNFVPLGIPVNQFHHTDFYPNQTNSSRPEPQSLSLQLHVDMLGILVEDPYQLPVLTCEDIWVPDMPPLKDISRNSAEEISSHILDGVAINALQVSDVQSLNRTLRSAKLYIEDLDYALQWAKVKYCNRCPVLPSENVLDSLNRLVEKVELRLKNLLLKPAQILINENVIGQTGKLAAMRSPLMREMFSFLPPAEIVKVAKLSKTVLQKTLPLLDASRELTNMSSGLRGLRFASPPERIKMFFDAVDRLNTLPGVDSHYPKDDDGRRRATLPGSPWLQLASGISYLPPEEWLRAFEVVLANVPNVESSRYLAHLARIAVRLEKPDGEAAFGKYMEAVAREPQEQHEYLLTSIATGLRADGSVRDGKLFGLKALVDLINQLPDSSRIKVLKVCAQKFHFSGDGGASLVLAILKLPEVDRKPLFERMCSNHHIKSMRPKWILICLTRIPPAQNADFFVYFPEFVEFLLSGSPKGEDLAWTMGQMVRALRQEIGSKSETVRGDMIRGVLKVVSRAPPQHKDAGLWFVEEMMGQLIPNSEISTKKKLQDEIAEVRAKS